MKEYNVVNQNHFIVNETQKCNSILFQLEHYEKYGHIKYVFKDDISYGPVYIHLPLFLSEFVKNDKHYGICIERTFLITLLEIIDKNNHKNAYIRECPKDVGMHKFELIIISDIDNDAIIKYLTFIERDLNETI